MGNQIQITRRAVCQAMSAGLSAWSATARGAGQRADVPGEYLLASAMYGTLPLKEVLAEVRKTGAGRIDLWRRPHANHWEQVSKLGEDKFADLLKEHDLQLGAVTFWDGDFENSLRFAARHGAPIVVTGFVPKARALRAFQRKIKKHLALAEELKVTLAIENHGASFDDIRRVGRLPVFGRGAGPVPSSARRNAVGETGRQPGAQTEVVLRLAARNGLHEKTA